MLLICKQLEMRTLSFFLVILLFCSTSKLVDSQAAFPLVSVQDSEASIPNTAQKAYVTTVGLVPTDQNSIFVVNTFISSAEPYYSDGAGVPGFSAFLESEVTSSVVSSTLILVTYTVRYTLNVMRSSGVTDATIRSTIGNYEQLQNNIGNVQSQLTAFYTFQPTSENFVFTGRSVCDEPGVTCNGTDLTCTEALDGVSVLCVSPCKLAYCQNNGTCSQLSENSSPTCSCLSTSDIWYLGARCEVTVALWMVIVAAVGSLILVIVVIVLACCFYSARVKKKRKKMELVQPAAYRNYSFAPDENSGKSPNTPITRNGIESRKFEARPESTVFRPRSIEETDGTRQRRRSYSSDRRDRHRRLSPSYTSKTSSASSVSSGSFESSSDGASDPHTSDHESSIRSRPSESTHPAPYSYSTASNEFGGGVSANEVDLNTRDQGTSPIRWFPSSRSPKPLPDNKMGKVNIADRKGWLPSLGPQMFNLKTAEDKEESEPDRSPIADTDI